MASKQQRAAERRRLQRQAERRQQRAQRRKRLNLIISIVGVIVVVGGVVALLVATGGSDNDTAAASDTPSAPASSSASASVAAYPCTWKRSDAATPKKGQAKATVAVPTTTTPPKTGTVQVAVTTTRGNLAFTLDRAKAPCAVASFLSLTKQKYFDSTPCHRLVPGPSLYVLQCGSPDGSGNGGPGYSFADELKGTEKYTTGVLAMANSGKNTNGSQFFIVYKNSQLQPDYTVFGTVTKGLDVVDKVAAGGVGSDQTAPKIPITLTKVTAAA